MKLCEILASDKLIGVRIKAAKKRKNNPRQSKTTKLGSFVDVFGGMADYDSPNNVGPETQR